VVALGLASSTFLLLVGAQISRAFERDLAGIDVVVGAKGSPMQLILSGVLHIDVPPGNVPLAEKPGASTRWWPASRPSAWGTTAGISHRCTSPVLPGAV